MVPVTGTFGAGFVGGAFRVGRGDAATQWRLGFATRPAGTQASHLALANRTLTVTVAHQNNLSATAFTTEGVFGQAPTTGAMFAWRLEANAESGTGPRGRH